MHFFFTNTTAATLSKNLTAQPAVLGVGCPPKTSGYCILSQSWYKYKNI